MSPSSRSWATPDALARLTRSLIQDWTPGDQMAFISMVLMGPCPRPCTCVVERFRAGIDASNDPPSDKAEAHRIADAIERAMVGVQASFQRYRATVVQALVADAERHANGEG